MSFYETYPNTTTLNDFYETYVTVTYNTPTFNELLRDLSKANVTAIYDM